MTGSSRCRCARAAISGTTPPKRACRSVCEATTLARTRGSSVKTAAAVSSQEVSMARKWVTASVFPPEEDATQPRQAAADLLVVIEIPLLAFQLVTLAVRVVEPLQLLIELGVRSAGLLLPGAGAGDVEVGFAAVGVLRGQDVGQAVWVRHGVLVDLFPAAD